MCWSTVPLAEFVTLKRGMDLPHRARRPGPFRVLSSGEAWGWHDEGPVSGPGFVVGRATNIGRPTWSDDDYWPLNTVLYAADFKGNDPRFAYYWFLSNDLSSFNSGSVQPMLNRNYIANIPIQVPPIEEQRAIAATLGALDGKRECNVRLIGKLEGLGSALLESVLRTDVYGLPAYEVGTTLGDKLSLVETGSRPRGGAQQSSDGIVSLGAESIQSAGVTTTTRFKKVSVEYAASMRRGHLLDGDVLVYKDGGKPGNFIPHVSAFGRGFPVVEAVINEHVYRVRAVKSISQGLLYWILRSEWMDHEMRKRGTGVAIPGLNSTNFQDLPWPVIATADVERLNEVLDPMLMSMLRLGAENRQLATLRDALLPELLSGRMRVRYVASSSDTAESGRV